MCSPVSNLGNWSIGVRCLPKPDSLLCLNYIISTVRGRWLRRLWHRWLLSSASIFLYQLRYARERLLEVLPGASADSPLSFQELLANKSNNRQVAKNRMLGALGEETEQRRRNFWQFQQFFSSRCQL